MKEKEESLKVGDRVKIPLKILGTAIISKGVIVKKLNHYQKNELWFTVTLDTGAQVIEPATSLQKLNQ